MTVTCCCNYMDWPLGRLGYLGCTWGRGWDKKHFQRSNLPPKMGWIRAVTAVGRKKNYLILFVSTVQYLILSAYKRFRNLFVLEPGAVITLQTSHGKLILTQVLVSLQVLTSSFWYNCLPSSVIQSTFGAETPTLLDEINMSYSLPWIFFFLPAADLILKAQQSMAMQGLPFTYRPRVLFFQHSPPLGLFMWVVPALADNAI